MNAGFTVLLVDDNPADRILVIRELSREFNDVEFLEVGAPEALQAAFERDRFDVVITDYHLNWTDGLQIMAEVRSRFPETPVIMFTGSGDEHTAQRALAAGASDYVVKNLRHRTRIVLALRNALDRVRQFEMLRRTERLAIVGQMMGALAHEINNPLEAATNLLYLISNNASAPEVVRDYAAIAQAELSRAARIANKTLGFVRESPVVERVQLNEVVDDALALMAIRLQNHKIDVIRDYGPTQVWGSSSELRQVIANLVANAAEAMESTGGRLRVRMRSHAERGAEPGNATILVCDTGPGIPNAARGHIAEPFFTTKGSRGTGLGLWISNEIVRKHGGRMRFRSTTAATASGTCFRVVLPQSLRHTADPAQTGTAAPS
jgi:signal transduction histidine kinase